MRSVVLIILAISVGSVFAAPKHSLNPAHFAKAAGDYFTAVQKENITVGEWASRLPMTDAHRMQVSEYLKKNRLERKKLPHMQWNQDSTVVRFIDGGRAVEMDFAEMATKRSVKINGKRFQPNAGSSFAAIAEQYAAHLKNRRSASLDPRELFISRAFAQDSAVEDDAVAKAQADYAAAKAAADEAQAEYEVAKAAADLATAEARDARARADSFGPVAAIAGPLMFISGLDQALACATGADRVLATSCVFGSDSYWIGRTMDDSGAKLTSFECDANNRFQSMRYSSPQRHVAGKYFDIKITFEYPTKDTTIIRTFQGGGQTCEYHLKFSALVAAGSLAQGINTDSYCDGRNINEPLSLTHAFRPGDRPRFVATIGVPLERLKGTCANQIARKEIKELVERHVQELGADGDSEAGH